MTGNEPSAIVNLDTQKGARQRPLLRLPLDKNFPQHWVILGGRPIPEAAPQD